ncbi:DsbA family protein [Microbacterium rhizosphaerae]|uniref:Thioredoxin domain-containing protein n=1 Tax=Microbacterium rhizosphaerae TaxID=1678237 RepID=A0ABZ0SN56_9MICO|nr:thioredoxin domain-containing protein [Microbacterium rhizosphaerae]WPR90563.1 thioredoxin domain-containing protein [Microbacterium rhizosphaerae]
MATTARKTNWFAIWVSIAVVAVLAVVTVLVVVMNTQASSPGDKPQSSHITSSGAIVFGDSKTNTVTTYIDFLCPICNEFEQSEGATIKTAVDAGKTTLEVVPVAILDTRSNPAGYSSRAGSAMYSVVIHDYANAYAFMQAMYANQPQEGSAGLTDQQIIDVAKNAGVNMTPALESEITSNKYQKYVQAQQLPQGATGTPTLVVNGTQIPVTMNPATDITPHLK